MDVLRLCIGLYGISGVGKSTFLGTLESGEQRLEVVEGSDVLAKRCGSLDKFKSLGSSQKRAEREAAGEHLIHRSEGNPLVVAAHFSFPAREQPATGPFSFEVAFTDTDARLYTHVVYLEADAQVIASQSSLDTSRSRQHCDNEELLEQWQRHEIDQLRTRCERNGTPFSLIGPLRDSGRSDFAAAKALIHDWLEQHKNRLAVQKWLKDSLEPSNAAGVPKSVFLLIDGDGTLAREDT
eukprot:CAMPEP_0174944910 /NCGR_PEP_ID=MMETSP1355-20121228/80244_1 /TAXON_ID=464990 /ORGANISM="Hemiselmis tepida, Strain CCMP443" /LENGTH=237 /DNA_ID=CAMNT_0016192247 /DNA_START=106 /DNA_END=816 /DNA_ORIENTATION=-